MSPQLHFFVTLDHYLCILIILKSEHKTPTSTPLQLSALCVAWGISHPGPRAFSKGKESACNTGDPGSIPELRESSGEGNGNPLQYSCLKNSTGRGVWRATVRHNSATNTKPQCLTYFHFKETLGPSCKTLPRVASKLLHFFSNKCPLCLQHVCSSQRSWRQSLKKSHVPAGHSLTLTLIFPPSFIFPISSPSALDGPIIWPHCAPSFLQASQDQLPSSSDSKVCPSRSLQPCSASSSFSPLSQTILSLCPPDHSLSFLLIKITQWCRLAPFQCHGLYPRLGES